MSDKKITIELQYPIKTADGREIKTVTLMGRPKVRDLRRAQRENKGDDAAQELALLASLTEEKLTLEDMEELDLADFAKVQEPFHKMVGR